MDKEITRIFNRQFERCKSELLQVNCPQIYLDSISKYFNFLKIDIKEIMEHGNRKINNN